MVTVDGIGLTLTGLFSPSKQSGHIRAEIRRRATEAYCSFEGLGIERIVRNSDSIFV